MPPSVFEALRTYRLMQARKLELVSDGAMDFVPPGESNNARWHLAHLITTPYLLTYARVGAALPLLHPEFVGASRKGTRASDLSKSELFSRASLSRLLFSSLGQLKADWKGLSGRPFTPYETASGLLLTDLDGALTYSLLHEGWHTALFESRIRIAEANHV